MYQRNPDDTLGTPAESTSTIVDDFEEAIPDTEPVTEASAPAATTPIQPAGIAEPGSSINPAPTDHAGALLDFKQELSRAMRSAAEQERDRITTGVAASAEAHLQRVRDRAAGEAEGFRHLADQDVEQIREWSKAESARIYEEADRRMGARRQQLDRHVDQHASITEREVGSIESAIEGYRAELDRFFARLTTEQDPTEFARLAGLLPPPPDLDEVGEQARGKALDEFRDQAVESSAAGPVAGDEDRLSTFSPTEPGPGLVGVMAPSEEPATEPAPVMATAQTTTVSDRPLMGASDPELEEAHHETSGTLQRLRSFAGLSAPRHED